MEDELDATTKKSVSSSSQATPAQTCETSCHAPPTGISYDKESCAVVLKDMYVQMYLCQVWFADTCAKIVVDCLQ
jgi:hypothetical protein